MVTRQIVLDTETTGLDPSRGHRLTEIGCLEMIDRRLTGRRFQTYLNPEREIEKAAAEITGLTNEFLQDKPKFAEVADAFWAFLQKENTLTELIIHNASFDLGFLNHEFGLLNRPICPIENHVGVICTLRMARALHPGQRNSLDALCKRYNIDNSNREFHGALLDAELLVKVYWAMTAGQTTFSLETEPSRSASENRPEAQANLNFKPVKRDGSPLRVIRATEEELKAHEVKMQTLF